jgi:hypothetical protein
MVDRCMSCTVRGDLETCLKTVCSEHDSWFFECLEEELKKLQAFKEEVCRQDPDLHDSIMDSLSD